MTDRYVAFMLRMWQAGDAGEGVWRASLEHAHTGEQLAFADPAALFAFLQTLISSPPSASSQREASPEPPGNK